MRKPIQLTPTWLIANFFQACACPSPHSAKQQGQIPSPHSNRPWLARRCQYSSSWGKPLYCFVNSVAIVLRLSLNNSCTDSTRTDTPPRPLSLASHKRRCCWVSCILVKSHGEQASSIWFKKKNKKKKRESHHEVKTPNSTQLMWKEGFQGFRELFCLSVWTFTQLSRCPCEPYRRWC